MNSLFKTGFRCQFNDDCLTITFSGPKDTLFQDEIFDLNVQFDVQYPFSPPKIKMKTAIYHPNIDKGEEHHRTSGLRLAISITNKILIFHLQMVKFV